MCLIGVLGGFVNGFFGTGGGIVLFWGLTLMGTQTKSALATTNLAIGVFSLISILFYRVVPSKSFFVYTLPMAFLFSALGAFISSKISTGLLKRLFSIIVIVCGLRSIL